MNWKYTRTRKTYKLNDLLNENLCQSRVVWLKTYFRSIRERVVPEKHKQEILSFWLILQTGPFIGLTLRLCVVFLPFRFVYFVKFYFNKHLTGNRTQYSYWLTFNRHKSLMLIYDMKHDWRKFQIFKFTGGNLQISLGSFHYYYFTFQDNKKTVLIMK